MNPLSKHEPEHMMRNFSMMADDFLIYLIMIKSNPLNYKEMVSLPFLHAHILELSIKSACLKLGCENKEIIEASKNQHNIVGLYRLLSSKTKLSSVFPSDEDFANVESLFTKTQSVYLPKDPDHLELLEMAFFCKNIADLKYGHHKDGSNISDISISYPHFNHYFLSVFKEVRKIYADMSIDNRFLNILTAYYAVSKHTFTDKQIKDYISSFLK